jgi:gas vesicle protein
MAHQQDSGAGVLLAFIAGAAVGAAAALLFAPAKGEETREAVNRRAREGRDKVLEAFDRARQQVRDREQDA